MTIGILIRPSIKPSTETKGSIVLAQYIKNNFDTKIVGFCMTSDIYMDMIQIEYAGICDIIYLLSDDKFAGSDTLKTSFVLSSAIKKYSNVKLLIADNISEYGETGHVPFEIGTILNIPILLNVFRVDIISEESIECYEDLNGIYEVVFAKFPAIIACKDDLQVKCNHETNLSILDKLSLPEIRKLKAKDIESDISDFPNYTKVISHVPMTERSSHIVMNVEELYDEIEYRK